MIVSDQFALKVNENMLTDKGRTSPSRRVLRGSKSMECKHKPSPGENLDVR